MDHRTASSEGSSSSSSAVEAANVNISNNVNANSSPDRLSQQVTQSFLRGRGVSSTSPALTVDSGLSSTSVPSSPTKEMSPVPVPVSFQEHGAQRQRESPTIQIVARHNIRQFNTNFGEENCKTNSAETSHPFLEGKRHETASNKENNNFIEDKDPSLQQNYENSNEEENSAVKKYAELREDEVMRSCDASDSSKLINMEPTENNNNNNKVYPMAFTVDFGDDSDTKKSLEITDSISKFAPRHRRNLSLSKADEFIGKGGEENSFATPSERTKHVFRKGSSIGNEVSHESSTNARLNANVNLTAATNINNGTKSKAKLVSSANSSFRRKASDEKNSNKFSSLQNSQMEFKNVSNGNGNLKLDFNAQKPSTSKSLPSPHDDNASETGTYTVEQESADVRKARKIVDNAVGEALYNDSIKEGTLGWVREWAEQASLHSVSPDASPESETQCLLYETENLVSVMQKRVSKRLSAKKDDCTPNGFDQEKNNNVLRSTPRNGANKEKCVSRTSPSYKEGSVLSDSGYALGYASDSSNEGCAREFKNPVKYNRAFAIRRSRAIGYDSDGCANRQSMTLPGRCASPRPQQHGPSVTNASAALPPKSASPIAFSRSDGGRFSLRAPSKTKTNLQSYQRKENQPGVRSDKNLNTASVESSMKKQPSPPKSTVFLKKGPVGAGARSNSTLTAKEVELANWKRRKNYDPMKAAQSTIPSNFSSYGKKKDAADKFCGSGSESPTEDVIQRVHTPLYKNTLLNSSFAAHSQSYYNNNVGGNSEDEDSNEMASTHSSSSPTNLLLRSHQDETHSQRSMNGSKYKLEALDSLVIATIHSLSVKVRTCSKHLLEKLQVHYSADENGALLEEMVSQLKDLEAASSPVKSTSRELSGTLKNLKKIEQVILVLDRVLCDDPDSDVAT